MAKKVKTYKSQSVIPHRRAKAESSSRSHLQFPKFIQPTGLSAPEKRKLRRAHGNKQTIIVHKRAQLTKNYMNLPNKVASAAKRKPATKNVYNKFQVPNDIRRKINKMI